MEEKCDLLIAAVGVAILGSLANWVTSDKQNIFSFFVSIFVGGFVGFIVGEMAIEHYGLKESYIFFICGSAGVSAEAILKLVKRMTSDKITFWLDSTFPTKKGDGDGKGINK